jgi:transcriptional regulator with XRE-family HTH domain
MRNGGIEPDLSQRLQSLGSYVRARRRSLGLTQTQLGRRLGYYQERISAIERGRYGMPSLPACAQMADALEVGLGELIEAAGYSLHARAASDGDGAIRSQARTESGRAGLE